MAVRGTYVWDLSVRLTHWTLVLLVLLSFGTAELGWLDMQWHFYSGYAILVLCLFRLLWGFCGSQYARFGQFLSGPGTLFGYLRGQQAQSIGHNPLGGWSVLLMLGLLITQAVTGLFNSDDIEWYGPLAEKVSSATAEWLGDLHEQLDLVLLAVLGVHVLAVFGYLLVKRQNLITPMFSGYKRQLTQPDARMVPWWLAPLLLAVSGALVWALISFWPASG